MARTPVSVEPRFRGGEGPPLVLLHAGFTSWRLWEPLLPFVTPSRDVLAPTLIGHYGGSPWELELGWMVEAAANDIEESLDEAGFERPDIAGNSIGGFIALELARRGRARRVIGIGAMGMYDADEAERIMRILLRQLRAAKLSRPLVRTAMRSPRIRRRALAGAAAHGERVPADLAAHLTLATASHGTAMWKTLLGEDGTARPIDNPEEIDVPVLLLWGDRDPFATRGQMERYQERLPQGRLVELPGLSHCPQLDEPERVAGEILTFTAGDEARR